MIYILITAAFLLLMGIMLLIPSVFDYKTTILLVTISYVYALLGVFAFSYLHWVLALLGLLVLALATAWITARSLPEGRDTNEVSGETEQEG